MSNIYYHPDYMTIIAYVGEKLGEEEQLDLDRHIDDCSKCLTLIQTLFYLRKGFESIWNLWTATEHGKTYRQWLEISRNIEQRKKTFLVLLKNSWHWIRSKESLLETVQRKLVPLSEEDIKNGREIGHWYLCSVTGPTIRLAASIVQPLSLQINLPQNIASINLKISPEYQPRENKEVWNLQCFLKSFSEVKNLLIGVGNHEVVTIGPRSLSSTKPIEFTLEPPLKDTYWIYFTWKSNGEVLSKERFELPLLSAEDSQKRGEVT